MTTLIATPHLVLILSLLLSVAGVAGAPRGLCLAGRVLLLLASIENSPALTDWIMGATVAWLPVRERIARRRAMMPQPAPPRS